MLIDNNLAAVVTGGASGLGQATARALAQGGVRVAIFDIDADLGQKVAEEIGGLFCHVDIMSEESVISGLRKARSGHGQERVLVHCAMAQRKGRTISRNKATGEFTRLPTEDFEYAAQGILVASYRLASLSALGIASLDPLADGERGCITLTASIAAQDAQIGQVAYGACKAGVNGLVLPMARDLMDLGVRVNSIMPGIFGTPLLGKLPQPVFDALSASVPFPKRLGKPEEFASLALELVRNTYMNGQNIRIDGAIRMSPR